MSIFEAEVGSASNNSRNSYLMEGYDPPKILRRNWDNEMAKLSYHTLRVE